MTATKPTQSKSAIYKNSEKINPVLGGVIGAVAGAALGSASIAAWNNEKTRKTMIASFETIKEQALKTFKELKDDDYIREKVKAHLQDGVQNKK